MKQVRPVLTVVISGVLLAGCARGTSAPATPTAESIASGSPATTTYDGPSLDRPAPTAQPVPVGSVGAQPRGVSASDAGRAMTASAVALAFARAACRYDARIDRSPWDASRRAARRWGTPSYAASLNVPAPGSGGQRWIALAMHDGYTVADGRFVDLDPSWQQGVVTDVATLNLTKDRWATRLGAVRTVPVLSTADATRREAFALPVVETDDLVFVTATDGQATRLYALPKEH